MSPGAGGARGGGGGRGAGGGDKKGFAGDDKVLKSGYWNRAGNSGQAGA